MTLTQSGYPVHTNSVGMSTLRVAGVSFGQCIQGPVRVVLGWVALQFNATVSALKSGQCGCFNPRAKRGGSGWSNHASATAIDCNTLEFPQGQRRMSTKQITACRAIVAYCGGVIRWGGDYGGGTAVDEQHFEINNNLAGTGRVEALAARLAGKPTITQEDDMPFTEAQLRSIVRDEVKNALNAITVDTTDYSVRPPKPRKGRSIPALLGDVSNFASGAAYNAGQASINAGKALAELQEGMSK